MFAVIFEVQPKPERWDDYLTHAASLRPAVETIEGFVSVERFTSTRGMGQLLSLSFWRDAAAVIRWRSHSGHRAVQAIGRSEIFLSYRLRVGEVLTGVAPPNDAAVQCVTICETRSAAAPVPDQAPAAIGQDSFKSLTEADKWVHLASWHDVATADRATKAIGAKRQVIKIIRDYGMFDRQQAPQYFPPVSPKGA